MSQTKPVVRIENWVLADSWRGKILQGNVQDHPRFLAGTFVYTSTIPNAPESLAEGEQVETLNTIYVLGKQYVSATAKVVQ